MKPEVFTDVFWATFLFLTSTTAQKVSVFAVILVRSFRIQTECGENGKIRTRITPITDTFYAVPLKTLSLSLQTKVKGSYPCKLHVTKLRPSQERLWQCTNHPNLNESTTIRQQPHFLHHHYYIQPVATITRRKNHI